MKKVVVLVAAVLLFASPALATIQGSKHDLTSATGSGAVSTTDTDETCVFCHTPHGASAVGVAPLWNRTESITIANAYGDPAGTMDAANATATAAQNTDAVLCLSCHDGATVSGALNNPPNGASATPMTMTGSVGTDAQIGDASQDLSNDHPIGFSFADSFATDGELNDKGSIEGTAGMAGALSYNGDDGTTTYTDAMWCSSCHDVHGGVAGTAFLRVDNAGSTLCTTCHVK